MHVKAGECVYGGDGVALRRHWWLSTNTHMHTHKHRICFHKSPVIPLLRTPEKVRQLPPISKRLKKCISEWVCACACLCADSCLERRCTPAVCVVPHYPCLSQPEWFYQILHSPPSQKRALSTCTGLRVLLACLRLVHGTLMHFRQLEEHVWTDTCTLNQPGSTVFAVSVISPHPVTYKEPL